MNNPFYIAKKDGRTENGSWYSILQDENNWFHISVTSNGVTLYDHFKNVPSIEYLDEQVVEMEASLNTSRGEQND
jgi:hypothetical protein